MDLGCRNEPISAPFSYDPFRMLVAMENEVATLRQRVEYLERQLLLLGNAPSAENTVDKNIRTKMCAFCEGPHPIWICTYFQYLTMDDRWTVAKKLNLCFRCLDNSNRHLGRDCPNTQVCRVRGCRLLHHRLLHDPDRRKLRTERHRVMKCVEPPGSDSGVQYGYVENLTDSDFSGFIQPAVTPAPPVGANSSETDSLNSTEATACDGEIDCQQMDELNRLAMLAEMTVPFDLILGGSCRSKQSLKSEYVTPAPPGEEDNSDMDFLVELEEPSLDPTYPTVGPWDGAAGAPSRDTLDAFCCSVGPEGQPHQTDNPFGIDSLNNTDLSGFDKPSGGEIDASDRPEYSSFETPSSDDLEKGISVNSLDSFDGKSDHSAAEKLKNSFTCSIESHDTAGKYNYEYAECQNGGNYSIETAGSNLSLENVDSNRKTTTAAPTGGQFDSSPAEVFLFELIQKGGDNKIALLAAVEDEIRRIDKEIASLDTPAELYDDNQTVPVDLLKWLKPI